MKSIQPAQSARVLVVEDEAAIRELLSFTLQKAGYAVVAVECAEQALIEINSELPDVLLLDVMLPGMSGAMLAKSLRARPRSRDLPILMVSARAGEEDKVHGLQVGADDYVVKPFSPRELVARIQAVLRRRQPLLAGEDIELGGLKIEAAAQRVSARGQPLALGPTEYRLLCHLMRQPERVHSRSQLQDGVWGEQVFIEERTVDAHIRRLRAALKAAGMEHLIQTVRGSGYRFSTRSA